MKPLERVFSFFPIIFCTNKNAPKIKGIVKNKLKELPEIKSVRSIITKITISTPSMLLTFFKIYTPPNYYHYIIKRSIDAPAIW